MKTLKETILESKVPTWDDLYYTLVDYVYDNGIYKHEVGKYALEIKDVFGTDTIKCTGMNYGTQLVLAIWIYPLNLSGREIGVRLKKGFEYLKNIDECIRFFGKDKLSKIYKHISKK